MNVLKQVQHISAGDIDGSNPLTQGMVFCYNADFGDIDLVRRFGTTDTYTSTKLIYPVNNYGYTSNTVGFSASQTNHLEFLTNGFSIFCTGYVRTLSTNTTFVDRSYYVSESNNQGWNLSTSGTNTTLKFGINRNNATTGASTQLEIASAVAVGKYNYVVTSNGSNFKAAYSNGRLIGSLTTGNMSPLTTTVPPKLQIGSASNNIVSNITCLWNRQLSGAEALALYENPHQIFKSKKRYFALTTYNITSYSGSAAVTLAPATSSLSVTHTTTPTASAALTLSPATGSATAFFSTSTEFVVFNNNYSSSAFSNGNTFTQISDTSTVPGFLGSPVLVSKTGTLGFGFNIAISPIAETDVVKYKQTNPNPLSKQEILYIKSDIKPIVSGGVYSF